MNLRNVLRTYSLLRQLTDDESALLATLRGMNESERELLVESLQPERKTTTKPAATRTVEKCGADGCSYTKRAAIHKDPSVTDYHEFQPPQPAEKKKSQRASSLAATLGKDKPARAPMCVACGNDPDHPDHGTGEKQHEFSTNVSKRLVQLMSDDEKCAYEVDGKVCKGAPGDAIHDAGMGYGGYHEFVASEQAAAVAGD